jgi:hypothetical protein
MNIPTYLLYLPSDHSGSRLQESDWCQRLNPAGQEQEQLKHTTYCITGVRLWVSCNPVVSRISTRRIQSAAYNRSSHRYVIIPLTLSHDGILRGRLLGPVGTCTWLPRSRFSEWFHPVDPNHPIRYRHRVGNGLPTLKWMKFGDRVVCLRRSVDWSFSSAPIDEHLKTILCMSREADFVLMELVKLFATYSLAGSVIFLSLSGPALDLLSFRICFGSW